MKTIKIAALLMLASVTLFSCSKSSTGPLPTTAFTFSGEGLAPDAIFFTNNSQNATSYVWSFGDGTTSTLQTPAHTYSYDGIFPVTLTATNSTGSTSFTDTVKVGATKLYLSSITITAIPNSMIGNKVYIIFKFPNNTQFVGNTNTVTSTSVANGITWNFGGAPTITDLTQPCQVFFYGQTGSSQSPSTDPNLLGSQNYVNFSIVANKDRTNNSYPTTFQYNSSGIYYNQVFNGIWQ